eukprot:3318871-Heterocapsa_arctica.AAC.2
MAVAVASLGASGGAPARIWAAALQQLPRTLAHAISSLRWSVVSALGADCSASSLAQRAASSDASTSH